MTPEPQARPPFEVVQRQVDADNARDLARVVGNYSDTVTVFRIPAAVPAIVRAIPFEIVVAYEVVGDVIERVWTFAPE